jgi:uncharacterized SAM-dependent methyltransferase
VERDLLRDTTTRYVCPYAGCNEQWMYAAFCWHVKHCPCRRNGRVVWPPLQQTLRALEQARIQELYDEVKDLIDFDNTTGNDGDYF